MSNLQYVVQYFKLLLGDGDCSVLVEQPWSLHKVRSRGDCVWDVGDHLSELDDVPLFNEYTQLYKYYFLQSKQKQYTCMHFQAWQAWMTWVTIVGNAFAYKSVNNIETTKINKKEEM